MAGQWLWTRTDGDSRCYGTRPDVPEPSKLVAAKAEVRVRDKLHLGRAAPHHLLTIVDERGHQINGKPPANRCRASRAIWSRCRDPAYGSDGCRNTGKEFLAREGGGHSRLSEVDVEVDDRTVAGHRHHSGDDFWLCRLLDACIEDELRIRFTLYSCNQHGGAQPKR